MERRNKHPHWMSDIEVRTSDPFPEAEAASFWVCTECEKPLATSLSSSVNDTVFLFVDKEVEILPQALIWELIIRKNKKLESIVFLFDNFSIFLSISFFLLFSLMKEEEEEGRERGGISPPSIGTKGKSSSRPDGRISLISLRINIRIKKWVNGKIWKCEKNIIKTNNVNANKLEKILEIYFSFVSIFIPNLLTDCFFVFTLLFVSNYKEYYSHR